MEKDQVNISRIVVIGGSAGSLEVLLEVLPHIRIDIEAPIVIVMHRKVSNDSTLTTLLAGKTVINLKEIEEKDPIERNRIYLAPADYHLLFEPDHSFSLDYSEKVNYSRPSIDVSFESAAEAFGESLVAILLSGANSDGTIGLSIVKKNGGLCVVQHPDDAEVAFMPRAAVEAKVADILIKVEELAMFINALQTK